MVPAHSVQGSGEPCRCEFPGEHLYESPIADSDPYITVEGTLVFPSSHAACADLWFVCPGVEFAGATPWTYECPSDERDGVRRRTASLDRLRARYLNHRDGQDERPYYSKDGVTQNQFPDEFHHLVDKSSSKEFYALLPKDHQFCVDGGSRIRSGETPPGECTTKLLSFGKAGDRRPLPGGTTVKNEWFPNLGVKITASSQGGPDNMHPVIFDMTSPDTNGLNHYKASMLGKHEELGNVLVPLRQDEVTGPDNDYGMLNFDFYEKTLVNYITLLNVDDFSKLFVRQADGSVSIYGMDSVGRGGVQSVEIGLENVVRLSVSFKTFAAVVSMDLCIIRMKN